MKASANSLRDKTGFRGAPDVKSGLSKNDETPINIEISDFVERGKQLSNPNLEGFMELDLIWREVEESINDKGE